MGIENLPNGVAVGEKCIRIHISFFNVGLTPTIKLLFQLAVIFLVSGLTSSSTTNHYKLINKQQRL